MKFRGHNIEDKDEVFVYSDTLEPVAENWQKRGCGHCEMKDTPEGHDGCLGTLDENIVMNACCGHGNDSEAYVQFWGGENLRGSEAIELQKELRKNAQQVIVIESGNPHISAKAIEQLKDAGMSVVVAAQAFQDAAMRLNRTNEQSDFAKSLSLIANSVNDLKSDLVKPRSKYHK